MKLKFYLKPKNELTLQAVRDLDWTEKRGMSTSYRTVFQKGNYTLIVWSTGDDIPVVSFYAIDPIKIDYMPDPENFKVTMKCPTVEIFKIITDNI